MLATYAAELMKQKMDAIYESSGDQALSDQIAYINKVIGAMDVETEEELQIEHPGEQLLSVLSEKDEQRLLGRKAKDALRPETSMAYSSLFTGAAREPQMLTELKKEIVSADRIDMLVSFIKWSGLRELLEELRSFTAHGGRLRVICTSFFERRRGCSCKVRNVTCIQYGSRIQGPVSLLPFASTRPFRYGKCL